MYKLIFAILFAVCAYFLVQFSKPALHTLREITNEDRIHLQMDSFSSTRSEFNQFYQRVWGDPNIEKTASVCKENTVAVGPFGERSIGYDEWKKGFDEDGVTFKSVTVRPGTEIIRFFNDGRTAVRNVLVDVVFDTPIGEVKPQVMRLETFVKNGDEWCMVAGQGTIPGNPEKGLITSVAWCGWAFLLGMFIMWLLPFRTR